MRIYDYLYVFYVQVPCAALIPLLQPEATLCLAATLLMVACSLLLWLLQNRIKSFVIIIKIIALLEFIFIDYYGYN